jgi:RNA 2',3'-cyclic 3'-phosphodiesterase
MKRLFFALDISTENKQLIANWREQQLALPYKTIDVNNFHITLCFLGNSTAEQQALLITKANKLIPHIANKSETSLLLDHYGLFKKPKVFYLGLQYCPVWLTQLAANFSLYAQEIGFFQEQRPYRAHLSIYRKASELKQPIPVNFIIDVKSFSLYQSLSTSHGVSYQPLKTWPLTTSNVNG